MASQNAAIKRLHKELKGIEDNPIDLVSTGPDSENLFRWVATITGPEDTPYEGGVFRLDIEFPSEYPFRPPKVKFVTPIYHPNIDRHGGICLDILRDKWRASLTISNVLLSICSLLNDPNPNDPLEPQAANLYKSDIEQYKEVVRRWTRLYASQ